MVSLKEAFEYRPSSKSGLVWKIKVSRKVIVGSGAGTYDKRHGYWVVRLGGKAYQAHRVVWEILRGKIPNGMTIDHRDGNVHNNNILNLRLATTPENNLNRHGHKQDGYPKGIRLKNESTGLLEARVKFDGKEYTKTSKDLEYLNDWLMKKRSYLHKDFCNHA